MLELGVYIIIWVIYTLSTTCLYAALVQIWDSHAQFKTHMCITREYFIMYIIKYNMGISHGVLYYRPSQRACNFCI